MGVQTANVASDSETALVADEVTDGKIALPDGAERDCRAQVDGRPVLRRSRKEGKNQQGENDEQTTHGDLRKTSRIGLQPISSLPILAW